MKLNQVHLKNTAFWEKGGFRLLQFDRKAMIKQTLTNPEWIHFGAGNIFRAFPAAICQDLLEKGILKTGIIVAEGYDYEIIDKVFKNHDNLTVLVTLKTDGTMDKKIIGSIAEALCMDTDRAYDWNRLISIFKNPGLKMASFTITEKGYSLTDSRHKFLKSVSEDFNRDPFKAFSYMGKLTALCYARFQAGKYPLTLVSMDNCSHNGTRLYEAVTVFAQKWALNGMVEPEFYDYVTKNITYPLTMIDKITPRPAESVMKMLKENGLEDTMTIVTAKNTYTAPFVNAEESQYLVIEDRFCNGRLPLEEAGLIFADRETVDKVEKMKVCTCLNPLHTALAIFGCLLSYHKISDEMKDPDLRKLVEKLGYEEGLPVVVNPGIINPQEFLDEVLNKRLPNPSLGDTPQRIASDTSQKLSIRFGVTIKAYQEKGRAGNLKIIPLVLAGWCRYLMAIDDKGVAFELSPDPMLPVLQPVFQNINLENNRVDRARIHEKLKDILSNEKIFGLDLYTAGLGNKVEAIFTELIGGKGAVRRTLKKYLDEKS
ncbi:MAG: D-mannonate oxidoreductase [Lachnoclostridium sp.]|jgi:fructuronate reductase